MTPRRSLRELCLIAMVIVMSWILFAIYESSETYQMAVGTDYTGNQEWLTVICYHVSAALMWAAITPLVVFVAERFPLVAPLRWRNVAALPPLIVLLAAFRAAYGGAVTQIAEGATSLHAIGVFTVYSIHVRLYRNIFIIVVIIGVVNLVLAYRAAAARERSGLTARKQTADDEVQRLRAAVRPPFLFAVLDAVSAQVHSDPLGADRMLVDVGGVLRRSLELDRRGAVSLAEELEFVQLCLRVERTRTHGRFTVTVDVEEKLLAVPVPPLLLHGITESALLSVEAEGGHLRIEGRAFGDSMRLTIHNDDPRRAPDETTLERTRALLSRRYGEGASIETRKDATGVLTILTMPARPSDTLTVSGTRPYSGTSALNLPSA